MEEHSCESSEGGVLDKVRRHVRILVDIGRLARGNADLDHFLDQVVVQIARAVEIHHVKVLRYRPGKEGGRIRVSLVGGIGYGEARLTMSDNGRGMQNANRSGSGDQRKDGLTAHRAPREGGLSQSQKSSVTAQTGGANQPRQGRPCHP